MRSKNIARHEDLDSWDFSQLIDPLTLAPLRQMEFKLNSGGVVVLAYMARLNSSPELGAWLNQNCKGWFAHCKTIRTKRRKLPANYFFEIERDAVLAKTFHGGL